MSNVISNPWVMHGPNWSLPVWVHETCGMMRIKPHGSITRLMRQALDKRLSELGTSNGEDWFLTRETLEKFADEAGHAHGELPEDYISWVSHTGRVALTEQPAGMEGFYEELVRSGFATSVPKAQLLYGILCQNLLDRLVVQNKPVDLGFAKLQAVPLRIDWMRAISEPKMRRMMSSPHKEKIVRDALRDGRLVAFSKRWSKDRNRLRQILLWNITVRHKPAWWNGVIKSERALHMKHGPAQYMIRVKARLREVEDVLYEIVKECIAQGFFPSLKIPEGTGKRRGYQGTFIKPTIRAVKKLLRVRKGTSKVDARAGRKSGSETVGTTGTDVPKMPDLSQTAGDVRETRGDMVQPSDAAEGAGRLPLCNLGQGKPEVE